MVKIKGLALNAVIAMILVISFAIDYSMAKDENIYEEIQRYDKVLIKIDKNYVEEVDPGVLVDAAIEGMQEVLDPHTAYFTKKDYDELMVHTRAEFGGLGITISIRDRVLTVVSPLPGTPASMMGIMAGDRIITIEGKSTKGITVEDAVEKLRGKPGTKVTITIDREGESEPIEYVITRAIIHIKSVPYTGVTHDSIGYIRLISFSKESGAEVEAAIVKLQEQGIKGMILDLRNNPGGLLPAAIDVASKFLDKDRLVVYTRGRMSNQNKDYTTSDDPVLKDEIPLVVLVNEGSASASEIVAGAIQDWDRGVIMGKATYGKGSVQTVLPVDLSKDRYIKLTTAYYYTPSGRCINRPENNARRINREDTEEGHESDILDGSEVVEDTAAVAPDTTKKELFYTHSKRIVYGGGGITPDVVLERQKWERIEEAIERKSLFFKYAIKTLARMKENDKTFTEDFTVSEKIVKDFKVFLEEEKFSYETGSENAIKAFKKIYMYEYGDSAVHETNDEVNKHVTGLVENLQSKIEAEKAKDFERSIDYIKQSIKRELLAGAIGEEARFAHVLNYDPQVTETVVLLNDHKKYNSIISAPK
jgi:carboxyl-terminal processing protease